MVLANIPAGSHTLALRQAGYAEWTSAVTVTGGSYTEISGTLAPSTTPTKPMPQPTKSGLPAVIPLAGIGICGFLVLLNKKE